MNWVYNSSLDWVDSGNVTSCFSVDAACTNVEYSFFRIEPTSSTQIDFSDPQTRYNSSDGMISVKQSQQSNGFYTVVITAQDGTNTFQISSKCFYYEVATTNTPTTNIVQAFFNSEAPNCQNSIILAKGGTSTIMAPVYPCFCLPNSMRSTNSEVYSVVSPASGVSLSGSPAQYSLSDATPNVYTDIKIKMCAGSICGETDPFTITVDCEDLTLSTSTSCVNWAAQIVAGTGTWTPAINLTNCFDIYGPCASVVTYTLAQPTTSTNIRITGNYLEVYANDPVLINNIIIKATYQGGTNKTNLTASPGFSVNVWCPLIAQNCPAKNFNVTETQTWSLTHKVQDCFIIDSTLNCSLSFSITENGTQLPTFQFNDQVNANVDTDTLANYSVILTASNGTSTLSSSYTVRVECPAPVQSGRSCVNTQQSLSSSSSKVTYDIRDCFQSQFNSKCPLTYSVNSTVPGKLDFFSGNNSLILERYYGGDYYLTATAQTPDGKTTTTGAFKIQVICPQQRLDPNRQKNCSTPQNGDHFMYNPQLSTMTVTTLNISACFDYGGSTPLPDQCPLTYELVGAVAGMCELGGGAQGTNITISQSVVQTYTGLVAKSTNPNGYVVNSSSFYLRVWQCPLPVQNFTDPNCVNLTTFYQNAPATVLTLNKTCFNWPSSVTSDPVLIASCQMTFKLLSFNKDPAMNDPLLESSNGQNVFVDVRVLGNAEVTYKASSFGNNIATSFIGPYTVNITVVCSPQPKCSQSQSNHTVNYLSSASNYDFQINPLQNSYHFDKDYFNLTMCPITIDLLGITDATHLFYDTTTNRIQLTRNVLYTESNLQFRAYLTNGDPAVNGTTCNATSIRVKCLYPFGTNTTCVSKNFLMSSATFPLTTGINVKNCFQNTINLPACNLTFSLSPNFSGELEIQNMVLVYKPDFAKTYTVQVTATNPHSEINVTSPFTINVYECFPPLEKSPKNSLCQDQSILINPAVTSPYLLGNLTNCFELPPSDSTLCPVTYSISIGSSSTKIQLLGPQYELMQVNQTVTQIIGPLTVKASVPTGTSTLKETITSQFNVIVKCPLNLNTSGPCTNKQYMISSLASLQNLNIDVQMCFEAVTGCSRTYTMSTSQNSLFNLNNNFIEMIQSVAQNYSVTITATDTVVTSITNSKSFNIEVYECLAPTVLTSNCQDTNFTLVTSGTWQLNITSCFDIQPDTRCGYNYTVLGTKTGLSYNPNTKIITLDKTQQDSYQVSVEASSPGKMPTQTPYTATHTFKIFVNCPNPQLKTSAFCQDQLFTPNPTAKSLDFTQCFLPSINSIECPYNFTGTPVFSTLTLNTNTGIGSFDATLMQEHLNIVITATTIDGFSTSTSPFKLTVDCQPPATVSNIVMTCVNYTYTLSSASSPSPTYGLGIVTTNCFVIHPDCLQHTAFSLNDTSLGSNLMIDSSNHILKINQSHLAMHNVTITASTTNRLNQQQAVSIQNLRYTVECDGILLSASCVSPRTESPTNTNAEVLQFDVNSCFGPFHSLCPLSFTVTLTATAGSSTHLSFNSTNSSLMVNKFYFGIYNINIAAQNPSNKQSVKPYLLNMICSSLTEVMPQTYCVSQTLIAQTTPLSLTSIADAKACFSYNPIGDCQLSYSILPSPSAGLLELDAANKLMVNQSKIGSYTIQIKASENVGNPPNSITTLQQFTIKVNCPAPVNTNLCSTGFNLTVDDSQSQKKFVIWVKNCFSFNTLHPDCQAPNFTLNGGNPIQDIQKVIDPDGNDTLRVDVSKIGSYIVNITLIDQTGNSFNTPNFTVNVDCPPITLKNPTTCSDTDVLRGYQGLTTTVDLNNCFDYSASLACLPIYSFSSLSTVHTPILQINNSDLMTNSTLPGVYSNIVIKATDPQGNYTVTSPFQVRVLCKPPSLKLGPNNHCQDTDFIFDPSISNQSVIQNVTSSCFDTDSSPFCQVSKSFTTGAAYDLTNFSFVQDSLTVNRQFMANYTINITVSDFFMQKSSTNNFVIRVGCDPNMDILFSQNSDSQDIQDKEFTQNFKVPTYFSASYSNLCPVLLREISTVNGSVIDDPGISVVYNSVTSDWEIQPTNQSKSQEFHFYIKATLKGGSTKFFGPYTYNYGCLDRLNSWSMGTLFSTTNLITMDVNMTPNARADNFYTILDPVYFPTSCPLSKAEIVDVLLNGQASNVIEFNNSCYPTCRNVSLSILNDTYEIRFKVQYSIASSVVIKSPEIIVNLVCSPNSAQLSATLQNQTTFKLIQGEMANPIILDNFNCQPLGCCQLKYEASKGNSLPVFAWQSSMLSTPKLNPLSSKVEINFANTSVVGSYDFYLFGETEFQRSQFSNRLTVKVIPNCKSQNINLADSFTLQESDSRIITNDTEPKVRIETLVSNVASELQFDIMQRITYNMQLDCPVNIFLADIQDANTQTSIPSKMFKDFVQLKNNVFFFNKFSSPLNWNIFIGATNGQKTVIFEQPVLQMNYSPLIIAPKYPPKFEKQLSQVIINIPEQQNKSKSVYSIGLPKVLLAAKSMSFSLELVQSPKFVNYNAKSHTLEVNLDLLMFDDLNSIKDIDIKLISNEGLSTTYVQKVKFDNTKKTTSAFDFNGLTQKNNSNKVKSIIKQPELNIPKTTQNVTYDIKSVSEVGLMTILFYQQMNVSNATNMSRFNSSLVDIYILPQKDIESTIEKNETYPNLNISSWSVKKFTSNANSATLEIQLNFSNPRMISTINGVYRQQTRDLVVFAIKNNQSEFFYSPYLQKFVHEEYLVRNKSVKPQLVSTKQQQQVLDSVQQGQKAAIIILSTSMVMMQLNFMVNSNLKYFQYFMRTMQMIVHFPMLNVVLPSNVQYFFQIIIKLVTFDWLDQNYYTYYVPLFSFDDEKQKENESEVCDGNQQCLDIGYDSHNQIQILGSLWFIAMLYFAKVGVFLLYKSSQVLHNKKIKVLEEMVNSLFFSEIFAICLEGYFEFTISTIQNLKLPFFRENFNGEDVGYITSFIFAVIIITMPFGAIYIVLQKQESIAQPSFQERWKCFIENMSMKRTSGKWYNLIFMLRRLIYTALVFKVSHLRCIQIITIFFMNLICMTFAPTKPFNDRWLNYQLVLEESVIGLCSYNMYLFIVCELPDAELYGWSMIFTVALMFAVHLLVLLMSWAYSFYLLYVKLNRRFGVWFYEGIIKRCIQRSATKFGLEYELVMAKARRQRRLGKMIEILPPKKPRKIKIKKSESAGKDQLVQNNELPRTDLVPLMQQQKAITDKELATVDTETAFIKKDAAKVKRTPISKSSAPSDSPNKQKIKGKKKKQKNKKKKTTSTSPSSLLERPSLQSSQLPAGKASSRIIGKPLLQMALELSAPLQVDHSNLVSFRAPPVKPSAIIQQMQEQHQLNQQRFTTQTMKQDLIKRRQELERREEMQREQYLKTNEERKMQPAIQKDPQPPRVLITIDFEKHPSHERLQRLEDENRQKQEEWDIHVAQVRSKILEQEALQHRMRMQGQQQELRRNRPYF